MFTVLLDAPTDTTKRIQIAKLGDFKDPRYGEFSITAANVANWQKNLSRLPGGEALIDFEHRSERKPRDSKAAGWISGIDLDNDRVMADVSWTPSGAQAIKDREYRFLSPVYGPQPLETGEILDDALPSVALTNKPFLGSMPGVSLASEERVSEAIDQDPAARFYTRALDGDLGETIGALVLLDVDASERKLALKEGNSLPDGSYPIRNTAQLHAAAILAASGHGDAAAAKKLIQRRAKELGVDLKTLPGFASAKDQDSRRSMATESTELLTLLDLPADADEKALLAKVTELMSKATDPEPTKTLDQLAKAEGKRILDQAELTKLLAQAEAGERAAKELHEQRFETAFDKALNHETGAKVAPAEKDSLHHFYTLDADATLKMIEEREPIVPAKPNRPPTIELDADGNADPVALMQSGVHPDSHDLHVKIEKYMLDNKLPDNHYSKVLDQVASGAVRL